MYLRRYDIFLLLFNSYCIYAITFNIRPYKAFCALCGIESFLCAKSDYRAVQRTVSSIIQNTYFV